MKKKNRRISNLALILKAAAEGKEEIDYTEKCVGCEYIDGCFLRNGGEHLCTL